VALGVLSKGALMIAVFGPVLAIDLALAARRYEAGYWHWGHVALALGVFLVIALPWFAIGAIRQGAPFVGTFTTGDAGTARFFRPFLPSTVPAGSRAGFVIQQTLAYVPMLIVGILPWAGLLPGAVGEASRSLRHGPHSVRLATLWAAFLFAFLSLSAGDRVMRYLLPCLPPIAVLAARYLSGVIDDARTLRGAAWISLAAGLPLFAGLAWLAGAETPGVSRLYVGLALPSLIVFASALVAFAAWAWRGQGRRAVAWLAAGALASYALTWIAVGRHWERLWPWNAIGAAITRAYEPGDRVLVLGSAGAEIDFLSYRIEPFVVPVRTDAEFLDAWTRDRVIALISPDAYARLEFRLSADVLLRTPMGWVLATNHP
jgi:hypothetical protein